MSDNALHPALPAAARLSINRCNLPAQILGSLTFQRHPAPLFIDGVRELHRELFARLDALDDPTERAHGFMRYMSAHFCLADLEAAGFTPRSRGRDKADYINLVRGWSFDADGREGAVLKGWVESRFGLLPRFHKQPIHSPADDSYRGYMEQRTRGLYNTNALEAQLDLLYTFCQYELARRLPGERHLKLFRGVNRLDDHELLAKLEKRRRVVLLNNLNSFTHQRERADEFGDYILAAEIPLPKIFFFNRLLPGMLKGEDEYTVIGGVYEVSVSSL